MAGSVFGILAAVLQVAGYLLYIRNFARRSIRPNAASYVMFAYGTSLVAFLAWENGAQWQELLLPVACAAMSLIVAAMCFRKNATERVDRFEAIVFSADLWITIAYAALIFASVDNAAYAVAFLILGNVTTLTSFMPILRSTWRDPSRERAFPWVVWTAAYLALTFATLLTTGLSQPVLLLYPIANVLLHGAMTGLSLRKSVGGRRFNSGGSSLYHGPSPIAGEGVFAGRDYAAGENLWTMTGRVFMNSRTGQDPDFVGLAPGLWMDPDRPLNKLNHSCDANAHFGRRRTLIALRPIMAGEEVTFDYSTTEADPEWTMICQCGAANCRKGLHAIQISFAAQDAPPPASPLMQLIWRKRRVAPSLEPAFPQIVPLPEPRPVARREYRRRRAAPRSDKAAAKGNA